MEKALPRPWCHRSALRFVALACLAAGVPMAAASAESEIERILALSEPPPGVVFEVVSGDEDALTRVMPRVSEYAKRLKVRFPELEIAVVTHGAEQFALLSTEQDRYTELHAQIQSLTGERNIPVHVCGTHASWRNNVPEDFPDYVDVAASAPAQINDYRKLGFVVIVL